MIIKVKKNNWSVPLPKYQKDGDAGLDLYASKIIDSNYKSVVYDTELSFEIRDGYIGFIYPRSSVRKYDLFLANSVGVVDSNYRGTVQVSFKRTLSGSIKYLLNKLFFKFDLNEYSLGERICQLIILPYPRIELIISDKLSETERGLHGHGSTGK